MRYAVDAMNCNAGDDSVEKCGQTKCGQTKCGQTSVGKQVWANTQLSLPDQQHMVCGTMLMA
jgi:hypothetical protein